MDDTAFHREQMAQFRDFTERLARLSSAPGGESLSPMAATLTDLAHEPARIMDEAPALLGRLLTTAPQVVELLPRDLLWYLGGDCLHFMPDEEIERYTRLDEQRREALARGEAFSWREARASLLGLQ
jgi:hypothetical protein